VALERIETLGQKRGRNARSSLPDLAEGSAAMEKITDDDRRPAFRKQLRTAGLSGSTGRSRARLKRAALHLAWQLQILILPVVYAAVKVELEGSRRRA
jgi:hypothetical protein